MSEHAFDPMPDEQQENIAVAPAEPEAAEPKPLPNAVVTLDQVIAAITTKRWAHENDSTALWLNTSFPPQGRDLDDFVKELESYGIAVE